jgi:hypothetical protein
MLALPLLARHIRLRSRTDADTILIVLYLFPADPLHTTRPDDHFAPDADWALTLIFTSLA